jgi:hypothetical protein
MMMKAIHTSEMSVYFNETMCHYIPKKLSSSAVLAGSLNNAKQFDV